MALNESGAISLAGSTTGESIALELGLSETGAISLNDEVVRTLSGIASGAIVMPTNFYGASDTVVGPLFFQGYNSYSNKGNGNNTSENSFVQAAGAAGARSDWKDLAMSSRTGRPPTLAVDDSGRLWSWGFNSRGALGINIAGNIYRNSPCQIGSSTNWDSVSTGSWGTDRTSCAAVKTNGQVYAWGDNYFQQLTSWAITGTRNPCSSPVQMTTGNINQTYNQVISGVSKTFLCGYQNYIVKNNGTMYSAGSNYQGAGGVNYQYGDHGFEPVAGGITDWKEATSASGGNNNGYFLRENGGLYAAGNSYAGANARPNQPPFFNSSPIYIGGNYKTVQGINTGGMAIKNNGTLWTWGRNHDGQCGVGSTVALSSPTQIGSLNTWDKFFKGHVADNAAAMIKTDGTIWGVGAVASGLDINAPNGYFSSPIQIFANLTNAKTVAQICNMGSTQGTMALVE